MIKDRNIDWLRKKVYVNAMRFTGSIGATNHVGLGVGAPVASEIGSLNLGAMNIGAANDEYIHYMPVPYDCDPEEEMGFRVSWNTDSTTDADDVTFVFLADFKAEEAAMVAPVTVLDTTIAADTVGTAPAHGNKWTARGIKDSGFLTRAEVEDGLAYMMFEAKCTVRDPANTWILGVQFDYKIRATNSGS